MELGSVAATSQPIKKPGISAGLSFDRSAEALLNDDAVAIDFLLNKTTASDDNLGTANPDTGAPANMTTVPATVAPASVTLPCALMVPCVMVSLVPAALPALPGLSSRSQ
jgi:hypothetical protein